MTTRQRRHSPEQIVRKLRDADAMLNSGKDLAAVLQALEMFKNLAAARKLATARKADYDYHRPHSSLGYQTPIEFAARCAASAPKLLSATPQATSPLQQHSGFTQSVLS